MQAQRILILDDEPVIQQVLQAYLESRGCDVRVAESAGTADRLLSEWEPDAALVDIILPDRSGLAFMTDLRAVYPDTEVLIITGNTSVETALRALRQGAADYLEKPFHLPYVWSAVQRALEKRALALRNRALLERQEDQNRRLSSSVSLVAPPDGSSDDGLLFEVLQEFIRVATRELDVERASVMLLDEKTGDLKIAAVHGVDDVDLQNVRVPRGEGISGFVAETGEPFLVTDALSDGRLKQTNPELGGSFLSAPIALTVPIRSDCQILGVVNVTNRRSGAPLDARDVAYIRGLTNQLATAIEGARRSEQLGQAYRTLKATQDQLVLSERIQAVGQMAAGVAHDFNNALSVILARSQFVIGALDRDAPDIERVRDNVETVIKTALHGAETIKRIQDYTRIREDVQPSPVDLNAVVRETIEMSRPKWQRETEARGKPIEVLLDLGDVAPVCGNASELTQVINNLVFNAVEAMPDGGRLTFSTVEVDGEVRLRVADSGQGMDDETRRRLFEPFFTTKQNGQGLGTSIIYGIVTRHGGEIEVERTTPEGTTFLIRLPGIDRRQADRVADEAESRRETSACRVLFVDDDDLVRETYEEALRLGGHEVVGTSSSRRALEICRETELDLVITDLSMTEMSGLELAAEIKRHDPTMPVVLFSGWALQQQSQIEDAGIDRIMVKPCLVEDLLDMVRQTARTPAEPVAQVRAVVSSPPTP